MYANDTELHYCRSQLQRMEQVLQNKVERVSDWMAVNRLKVNVTKSVCMLIGSQQRVAGKDLCLSLQVLSTKYLGVYIDQYLICLKKSKKEDLFYFNHLNPPSKVKKLLYQVYLLPIINYCDTVCTPTNVNQTRSLERLHSKFISSCTDSSTVYLK